MTLPRGPSRRTALSSTGRAGRAPTRYGVGRREGLGHRLPWQKALNKDSSFPLPLAGQTFSAFVSAPGPSGGGATLRAVYPSLSAASVGSLHVASAPWVPAPPPGGMGSVVGQRTAGFFVSAPAADSLALSSGGLGAAMSLDVSVAAAAGDAPATPAAFSLVWASNGPVGADTWPFPGGMDARTGCDLTTLALSPEGFRLLSLPPGAGCVARAVPIASGPGCALAGPGLSLRIQVSQAAGGAVNVSCNGALVVENARVDPPGGASSLAGRAGIYAARGTAVNVSTFVVLEGWVGASSSPPLALLAVDAMSGAGNLGGGWRSDTQSGMWRFGSGLICDAGAPCERVAKWNFVGCGVALWAPRGVPGAGNMTASVDGDPPVSVDLAAAQPMPSTVVWTSAPLAAGRHALVVRASGNVSLPVDSVDVTVAPPEEL